jgi:hypothetical chaperone protein
MSRSSSITSVGIDFGTSNTVIALGHADGAVEALRFPHGGDMLSVYASALCFWQEVPGSARPARIDGGPWAFDRVLEGHLGARFIQSFKTFAASNAFQSTMIARQRYPFEDLLAVFLRTLLRQTGVDLDLGGARIVIGRPVRFAGSNPDEALAVQRYGQALQQLGVRQSIYAYEPVGAAFSYARALTQDATILVADFGGGTSDFSVMRFTRVKGAFEAKPLGHSGVGIAGDSFDARLVEHVVAPHFGKGGSYRSFGKVLPIPAHFFSALSRWHELAMMKGSANLRDLRALAHHAIDAAPLRQFIELIENDLGFSLYRSISAAKVALSSADSAEFRFDAGDFTIAAEIKRSDFERWIESDLARIGASVDQALAAANIAASAVDQVFLTGGTSFVPAVRKLFTQRFGAEKLVSADQFEAIAIGLALIGQSGNPAEWAAKAPAIGSG